MTIIAKATKKSDKGAKPPGQPAKGVRRAKGARVEVAAPVASAPEVEPVEVVLEVAALRTAPTAFDDDSARRVSESRDRTSQGMALMAIAERRKAEKMAALLSPPKLTPAEPVAPVAGPPPPPAIDAVAAPNAVVSELAIASIRLDGGTQSRAQLSEQTIAEYAEAMAAGATFPPVVVLFDGKINWLADGFHRVGASLKLGRDRITCDMREGSRGDAILFSAAANATHGLRRSNADKRHAVEMLLGHAKWSKKSDRWLAEKCGVSNNFVGVSRKQLSSDDSSPAREGKDGKARKLPVAKPTSVAPPLASPLTIAMAPTDEASVLAELQSDLDRHAVAWIWGPESFVAALEAASQRVRERSSTLKEVSNG